MSQKLKAVIIEDNPISVIILRHCLRVVNPEIEICGDANSINQAVILIETYSPDIIFLDIELKDGLSFQVADIIRQKGRHLGDLVFTSETERYEYLLKAIEYACLDFLPKPITENAVRRVIEKAQERYKHRILFEHLQEHKPQKKPKILIPIAQNSKEAVEIAKIAYFEAKGQCTIVHLSDGSYITAFRILGYFKKLLAENPDFYQIHHALLVNIAQIKCFRHKTHEITMLNGVVLEASRRLSAGFKGFWNELSNHETAQESTLSFNAP